MLRAIDVGLVQHGQRRLSGLSLELRPGEVHAVLGANGAGKSTLLQLLCGDLRPSSGRVSLDNRPLSDWPIAGLAARRAVLPQQEHLRFGFTTREVVELGRLASASAGMSEENRIVDEALRAAGVSQLAERRYPTLSGGERARVQFARVLAQVWNDRPGPPAYLLLDEPTASLDLAHQYDCLSQVRAFADRGGGALAVLHDPNQAMAFADRVSLLRSGQLIASGPPAEVLTAERLSELYGIRVELAQTPGNARPYIVVSRP
jgi:iron complex transport system ATP-binding protein